MATAVVDQQGIYSRAGRNDRPQANLEHVPTLQTQVAAPLERCARQLSALGRLVQNVAALARDGDELAELDPEEIVAVLDGAGEAIDAAHGALVYWYENELGYGPCTVIHSSGDVAAFRELIRALPEREGGLRRMNGDAVVSLAVRFLAGQPNPPLLLAELHAARCGGFDPNDAPPCWPWNVVRAARERGDTAAAEAAAACSAPGRIAERLARSKAALLERLDRASRAAMSRIFNAVSRIEDRAEWFKPSTAKDVERVLDHAGTGGVAGESIRSAVARANLIGLDVLHGICEEIEREHPDCFAPAGSKPGGGADAGGAA